MADSITASTGSQQILSNYEKYKEYFTEDPNAELGQDQFLALMVEQMKNQDFMDPTDNSEYIAQMAQFSMTQQIQQMNYYTNATYATSLVGKTVTTGFVDLASDKLVTSTGVVSAVRLNGNSFEIVVDGNTYQLQNIMEVLDQQPQVAVSEEVEVANESEDTNEFNETYNEDSDDTNIENAQEEEEPNYSQEIF